MRSRVAIVAKEPQLRLLAAKAFDAAPPEWNVGLFEEAPPDADVTVVCGDLDVDGVAFDPAEPVAVLSKVARVLGERHIGRAVQVVGATGGAGTTTVALHLSASLARRGSTLYLEMDANRGAADRLDLPSEVRTVDGSDMDDETLLRCAVPFAGGFRALLLPETVGDLDHHELIRQCATIFENVVIDSGVCAVSDPVLAARGILVMTPSIVSAKRARRFLDACPETRWAVLANRLGPGSETTRSGLERVLGRRLAIDLPCTAGLRDREDEGRLLERPWSRWCTRIDRLAAAVVAR
jgi:hypothetical protein